MCHVLGVRAQNVSRKLDALRLTRRPGRVEDDGGIRMRLERLTTLRDLVLAQEWVERDDDDAAPNGAVEPHHRLRDIRRRKGKETDIGNRTLGHRVELRVRDRGSLEDEGG